MLNKKLIPLIFGVAMKFFSCLLFVVFCKSLNPCITENTPSFSSDYDALSKAYDNLRKSVNDEIMNYDYRLSSLAPPSPSNSRSETTLIRQAYFDAKDAILQRIKQLTQMEKCYGAIANEFSRIARYRSEVKALTSLPEGLERQSNVLQWQEFLENRILYLSDELAGFQEDFRKAYADISRNLPRSKRYEKRILEYAAQIKYQFLDKSFSDTGEFERLVNEWRKFVANLYTDKRNFYAASINDLSNFLEDVIKKAQRQ